MSDTKTLQAKLAKLVAECEVNMDLEGSFEKATLSSDDDSFDDGLSVISDVSSVASIMFSPPKKANNRKNQNKVSKIPIRSKTDENKQSQMDFHPKVNVSKFANRTNPTSIKPINFLAVDLSEFSQATICIFEGSDFIKPRCGERSTYVVIRLHEELPVITTPISFNQTKHAVYNAGFELEVSGLNFENCTPVLEVYDFLSDENRELIGVGFIQLQTAKKEDCVCIVMKDEWINIYTLDKRTPCGKIKMSLMFHNGENISHMIKSEEQLKPKKELENPIVEQKTTMKESTAVQADVDVINSSNIRIDDSITISSNDFVLPFESNKSWKPPVINEQTKLRFVDSVDLDTDTEPKPSTGPFYSIKKNSSGTPKLSKESFIKYADFKWK